MSDTGSRPEAVAEQAYTDFRAAYKEIITLIPEETAQGAVRQLKEKPQIVDNSGWLAMLGSLVASERNLAEVIDLPVEPVEKLILASRTLRDQTTSGESQERADWLLEKLEDITTSS